MKALTKAVALLLALTIGAPDAIALPVDLQVGPAFRRQGNINSRGTTEGGQATADISAKYEEMVTQSLNAASQVFTVSNTAAQATSLNSPTATGLILTNPPGSGKNLVILEILIEAGSLPAGAAPFVVTGSTAVGQGSMAVIHTTPLVIQNALLGGPRNSSAFADSSATIPGNVIFRSIPGGPAATVATSVSWPSFVKDQVDGALVMGPGSVISIQSLTTAISIVATITYKEVPTP